MARTFSRSLVLAALGCSTPAVPDPAPEPPADPAPEAAAASAAHPLAEMRAHLSRQIEQQIEERRNAPVGAAAPGMVARRAASAEIEREIERVRASAGAVGALYGCVPSEAALSDLAGDLITHRPLTWDDFRAEAGSEVEPVADVGRAPRLGAHVVVDLACVARADVELTDAGRFEATLLELRYLAVLDRERSWWNPDSGIPEQWILRHEQGHFDLAEIEARRRNQASAEVMGRMRSVGVSAEDALESLAGKWERHLRAARTRLLGLELEYDRETRHGSDARKQSEWFARVQRELRGLPASEPPPPGLAGVPRR